MRVMQFHGGQVRDRLDGIVDSQRPEFPGGPAVGDADPGGSARIARRWLLKAAVFGPQDRPDQDLSPREAAGGGRPGPLPRAVTGTVLDVSPHVLVIGGEDGEVRERFTLTADAIAWRGTRTEPAALRVGDRAVVRRHGTSRDVADLIWANIGRVTGTIICRDRDAIYVDGGDGRRPKAVVVPGRAAGRIQVKFPRLQPGYLIDVIGVRQNGYLEGLIPATYQPTYRVDHVPAAPLISGHLPGVVSGAAVWHEPGGEPDGLVGAAYPAVDPQSGRPGEWGRAGGAGCVSLPYLSVGSVLRVRNDCTKLFRVLPVIGPATTAGLFCDRSVVCGPSPRGRIADLTVASFVELGGELDQGCFNVTIEIEG
jgi:hypothetical protein